MLIRGRALRNPWAVFLPALLLLFAPAVALPQDRIGSSGVREPATEAELRAAIADIDQLGRALETNLKRYREHLQAAMRELGYGAYHPIFRTSLNGFAQDEIDLDDLDEFKMGFFAYTLQDAGIVLRPDPFTDWMEVEMDLMGFEKRMNRARQVVARTNIFVAHSDRNIPPDVLRKLRKMWLSVSERSTTTHEHAMAVRAVRFESGEIVPAPANVRRIFGRGRYAVICAFNVCTSPAAGGGQETPGPPLVR